MDEGDAMIGVGMREIEREVGVDVIQFDDRGLNYYFTKISMIHNNYDAHVAFLSKYLQKRHKTS